MFNLCLVRLNGSISSDVEVICFDGQLIGQLYKSLLVKTAFLVVPTQTWSAEGERA